MFKKAVEAKSHQRISGADRKKLKRTLRDRFPRASDADIDSLLPPKTEVTVSKFQNRVLVYSVEGGFPVFFDVDGRGTEIFPTVFALWKVPELLPFFMLKGGEVSRFVIGGADLMFPGISVPAEGLPSFLSGEPWAVKVPGNPAPIAVGSTTMSSAEALKAMLRGKALRITHYYRDLLWESVEGHCVPNAGFLEDVVHEDPAFLSSFQVSDSCEGVVDGSNEQNGISNGESCNDKENSGLVSLRAPTPASVLRLWRPAAQRNLRNQWSKMASYHHQWVSASSSGRLHATSLVNSSLSQRYLPSMELGVLSDMPNIRNKACFKLFKHQEHHQSKLLSSYKDMVSVVNCMANIGRSMGCFVKGYSSSPLVQFSSYSEDVNDTGDGGGIPVFVFLSIAAFEELSAELVRMFQLELNLKRLLVVELLSTICENPPVNEFCWSDELYPGEFDDLSMCNLYSKEICEPVNPRLRDCKSSMPAQAVQHHAQPNREILQVYLTTWLTEVNIDTHRVNETFTVIGEEMHLKML